MPTDDDREIGDDSEEEDDDLDDGDDEDAHEDEDEEDDDGDDEDDDDGEDADDLAEEDEEDEGEEESEDEGDADAGSAAADATYFVMRCEGIREAAMVRMATDWYGSPWMSGQMINVPVPSPFVFRIVPQYPGELMPMYIGAVPLMRDDLIQALHEAGVDNLQLFPAEIRDEEKDITHTNYKAVNVIGLIACADMARSTKMDPEDDSDLIDVNFDSLVIDETKTGGALLFRLAESVNAIIVHKSVRERVERIPGMTFYGPGAWSG